MTVLPPHRTGCRHWCSPRGKRRDGRRTRPIAPSHHMEKRREKWQPGSQALGTKVKACRGGAGSGREEEERAHQLLVLLSERGGQGVHVGVLQGLPAQLVRLHVDHAAPASAGEAALSPERPSSGQGAAQTFGQEGQRVEASGKGGLGSQRDLVGIPAPDPTNGVRRSGFLTASDSASILLVHRKYSN